FWAERDALARRRLRMGDAAGAYALIAAHAPYAPAEQADAAFLAGFIALRRLGDPARAAEHFRALAAGSNAALTVSRAEYWLARAATDPAVSRAACQRAAAYPTTYYGQLAVWAIGNARIVLPPDPPADTPRALAFAGRELTRAAALLVAWGDKRRAAPFLLLLAEQLPDPIDRALDARLAAGFGLPEIAVAIGRRAGRDGTVLADSGWPVAYQIPAEAGVDPALALGVIRQESSFDPDAVSPAGARGLMQLMPATATETARQLRMAAVFPTALTDSATNLQLGTAYLRGLIARYDGSLPLAVAAYNAGPGRVAAWLGDNGDPRTGAVDMIDWIELIPIAETRNYAQRVIESAGVYAEKLGEAPTHPLTPRPP
ncbi:MAG: lytic transglycosylase domain-containing protein, partial [Acetobacteraceae bacterium]|nr:lytic transglycosylase domain-containing protein [Acetobacteraceae bacterium]